MVPRPRSGSKRYVWPRYNSTLDSCSRCAIRYHTKSIRSWRLHRAWAASSFCCDSRPSRIDVLKYLLDKGIPINSVMYENRADSYEQERLSGLGTPLHSAAASGSLEMVDMLLSRGADPLIKSSRGKLAVEEAEYYGWRNVIDRLRPLS